ncbi:heavy metal translocating P-type ATPase [Pseudomonas sp. Marseille-Q5115]|uniref:heavy metal translocating P-type ATPase n=1 Tax=Pseudomonas sp. Marseille-Q5115 TaxID=2866593 RepID=UPI001CE3BD11|nr:heavy metal translocating P-type ATPase [Pseudomonas sp. Marseille-Q5115]
MAHPATFELSIHGMTCSSCAGRVERALQKTTGVHSASVNLASERARVHVDASVGPARLIEAVSRAGYQAQIAADSAAEQRARQRLELQQRIELVLAFALAIPLVLPMLLMPLGVTLMLPPWVQFALATPVQFLAGARFYTAAWRALRARAANMDLLVALGTSAAYALSLFLWAQATLGQAPHLYFETAAVVIALVLLGKHLEARAKRRAAGAIRALEALRPATATRLEGGVALEVPLASLRKGDHLQVQPGERFAADGRVIEGHSSADESLLSGEALPMGKATGDRVSSGTLNGEGVLVVEVEATGHETLLEGIIRLVETAQAAKAPVQRLVDRVSRVFVPAILLLALATFIAWYLIGGSIEHALVTAVSVLVIACPCALGLATPAAILAGTGVAARHGLLIRDVGVIETAGRIRHVVFDKTGTLTEGKAELTALLPATLGDLSVLALAGALASGGTHPLAQAVQRACVASGIQVGKAQTVTALPGRGVAGQVNGRQVVLGSTRLLEPDVACPPALRTAAAEWEAQGMSVSWLLEQSPQPRVLGAMAFADTPRPEARAAIEALTQHGITCHMLTGDNPGSAARVASLVGITDVQASLLPAQKAQRVTELAASGPVAMVGDGINDAPALAAAQIGIAMAGATDVAAQAGAVVLARADLRLVPAALNIAAKVQRKIHQNLFWAFAYNLVGIPLAALGLLSPIFAGAAMALSSVSVVSNALLLNTWVPPTLKER